MKSENNPVEGHGMRFGVKEADLARRSEGLYRDFEAFGKICIWSEKRRYCSGSFPVEISERKRGDEASKEVLKRCGEEKKT